MAELAPTGQTGTPGVVVFVDCETRDQGGESAPGRQSHRLWFGIARAGRLEGGRLTRVKELRFEKPITFWSWLHLVKRPQEVTWLFAHNLGFDLSCLGFWKMLEEGEFTLTRKRALSPLGRRRRGPDAPESVTDAGLVLTEDPPSAVLCWHRSGWRLNCLDSMNYFPMGLKRLGAQLQLEKLPMPAADAPQETWDAYCRRDVEILETAICQLSGWWKRAEMGRWPLTIASGALTAWRELCQTVIPLVPEDQLQRDREREAAYGGRLEALWLGRTGPAYPRVWGPRTAQRTIDDDFPRGPFHLVDATSFYGWILTSEPLPVKTIQRWDSETGGELELEQLGPDCLASVRICHQSERFPVRTPAGVQFASGNFDTVLCGAELARAVEVGAVAAVYWAHRYELGPLLAQFGQTIWEELQIARADGLGAVEMACKLMLARLAGKFNQKGHRWIGKPEMTPPRPWGSWLAVDASSGRAVRRRSIAWLLQEQVPAVDPEHAWPAVFAWVAAAGREWLGSWARIAGSRDCLYLNTDGLIVTDRGRERLEDAGLIRPGELGGLRIVESSPSVEIRGPGSYTIGSRNCHMGRPLGGFESSPGIWTSTRFPSLLQTFAAGGPETIQLRTVATAIPERTQGGETTPTGWVVAPSIVASAPDTREQTPAPF